MPRRLLFVLLILPALLGRAPVVAQGLALCGQTEPCALESEGEYRVVPPPGWDGRGPIGVFVFMHGHRACVAEVVAYRGLVAAVHRLGFMLVAPQGLGDSWSTTGSPGEGRRHEVRFVAAMLDDLERRIAIDRRRVVASGFSQSASVVWEIACRGDGRFQAFLPIAGVWWRPMPTACPAALRPLLHIHGVADPVMPMQGRSLRDRWRQGDVREAFATIRRLHACEAAPRVGRRGDLACSFDDGCASQQPVALCLHDGDHHTNPAWLLELGHWLEEALAARRPVRRRILDRSGRPPSRGSPACA